MRILVICLILILGSHTAGAQNTYSTWKNPDAKATSAPSDKRMQAFVEKLNGLVDKAEEARAADPIFLRDLRALANEFDQQQQRLVLSDSFLDGNFEADPKWHVLEGEYWIEKGWGLRSAVEAATQTTPTQTTQQNNKDAAAILFGKILSKAMGVKQAAQPAQPTAPARATIHTPAQIPNAFALEAEFSSWKENGRMEIALYQGKISGVPTAVGYRIAYIPGGRIELLRVSSRGTTIVDTSTQMGPLEDKKFHTLAWLRQPNGNMIIHVDGKQILSAVDQGFRDPFTGLAVINSGGDYIVKKVNITGAG